MKTNCQLRSARRSHRGYGLALLMVFVAGTVIIISTVQLMSLPTSAIAIGRMSQNSQAARQVASIGMDAVEADIQNKLDTGQSVTIGYTYPTTTVNMPSDPNAPGTLNSAVGSYSATMTQTQGQSYLVRVTANVGNSTITLNKLIQRQSIANLKDFRFYGRNASDAVGYNVASAGDVNGDGYSDILMSAPYGDGGGTDSGESYLIFGRSNANWQSLGGASRVFNLDSMSNANQTVRFIGRNAGDLATVQKAGDVDGDGYDDILLGARGADGGGADSGEVYLIFGRPSTGTGSWTSLVDGNGDFNLDNMNFATNKTLRFIGRNAGDHLGYALGSAGDTNNDGYADIILGARWADANGVDSGEGYLIFGRPATGANSWDTLEDGSGNFNLDSSNYTTNKTIRFIGRAAGVRVGLAVSSTGDVDGDGYDDFMMGAQIVDGGGGSQSGEVNVIFGRSTASWASFPDANGDFNLAGTSYTGKKTVRFIGQNANDWLGYTVRPIGDIDSDGYDDFVMGADAAQGGGTGTGAGTNGSGELYLAFGRSAANWGSLVDASGNYNLDGISVANRTMCFWGRNAGDYVGEGSNGIGDINGDGYDDFIVSSPNQDTGGADAGDATVFFGRPASGTNSWQTLAGTGTFDLDSSSVANLNIRLQGRAAGDQLSSAVTPLGDVNGDGYNDFMVGAWQADGGGADSGEAYIFFGRDIKAWWSYPDGSGNFNLDNLGL